jgi:Raf kinase inhibitor-like YbhB/YbcL family protein
MKLTSPAFSHGARIPAEFTGDGADVSPPLQWQEVPEGTKSFGLICEDPDAPSPRRPAPQPWVHWVIYNIPGDCTSLPRGVPRVPELPSMAGARQGKNSWPSDNIGYRGPAPPKGSGTHRYFFRLYALDTVVNLPAKATKEELLQAIQGHILAEAVLMGTYER